MSASRLKKSEVIEILERAGIEVQPEATWAQIRPLYDDLIRSCIEGMCKSTEEENVANDSDEVKRQKQTTATTKAGGENKPTEVQSNEAKAATSSLSKNEKDEKSEKKQIQQPQQQNQNEAQTQSAGNEHTQQRRSTVEKSDENVVHVRFGSFNNIISINTPEDRTRTSAQLIASAQPTEDEMKQAQKEEEVEAEKQRVKRIMDEQHEQHVRMRAQQKLQDQRWAEAEARRAQMQQQQQQFQQQQLQQQLDWQRMMSMGEADLDKQIEIAKKTCELAKLKHTIQQLNRELEVNSLNFNNNPEVRIEQQQVERQPEVSRWESTGAIPRRFGTSVATSSSASTSSSRRRESNRCYNCFDYGHLSTSCPKESRPRDGCFICWQTGHTRHDCPQKKKK